MLFKKLRNQVKVIGIIIVVAFVGGALYIGGASFFGGDEPMTAQAAIATVNGQDISYYQFQQQYINEVQQMERQSGQQLQGMEMADIRYRALESLIGNVLLFQQIQERGISASEAEINERLEEFKATYESEEQFKQQMELFGVDENYLRLVFEQEVQMDKLRESVASSVVVTEEDIRESYERVEASHILIRPDGTDDEAWNEAQARIEELSLQLTPENFAEMAAEYSEDPGSAQSGGELGFFARGDMVEPFSSTAFSLPVGSISEPIQTDFGYHILLVTDRREAEGEAFEEERAEIESLIFNRRAQVAVSTWFENLRREADVVIREPQLKAVEQMNFGNYEQAIVYYQEALELAPENGFLYAALGQAYQELQRYDEAVAQFEKAVEFISNDASLFMAKAQLYEELDEVDKAVAAYLQASELNPRDLWFQFELYLAIAGLERWDDARIVETRISEIQQASGMMPAPSPEILDDEEAMAVLEEVLVETEDGEVEISFDEAAEPVIDAAEAVEDAVMDGTEAAAEWMDEAGEAAEELGEDLMEQIDEIIDEVGEAAEEADEAAEELGEDLAEPIDEIMDEADEAAEEAADTAAETLEEAVDTAAEMTEAAADTAEEVLEGAEEAGDDVLDMVSEWSEEGLSDDDSAEEPAADEDESSENGEIEVSEHTENGEGVELDEEHEDVGADVALDLDEAAAGEGHDDVDAERGETTAEAEVGDDETAADDDDGEDEE